MCLKCRLVVILSRSQYVKVVCIIWYNEYNGTKHLLGSLMFVQLGISPNHALTIIQYILIHSTSEVFPGKWHTSHNLMNFSLMGTKRAIIFTKYIIRFWKSFFGNMYALYWRTPCQQNQQSIRGDHKRASQGFYRTQVITKYTGGKRNETKCHGL